MKWRVDDGVITVKIEFEFDQTDCKFEVTYHDKADKSIKEIEDYMKRLESRLEEAVLYDI